MSNQDDEFREAAEFFEQLLSGPPGRPQHPDFMKLSSIVLQHDGPTNDPTTREQFSFEDTVNAVIDIESVTYMARGRASVFMQQVGLPQDVRVLTALASAWLDAFLVGDKWAGIKEKKGDST